MSNLKYPSFEELSKQAKFDFQNINFNSTQICNSLLKMYDKGNLLSSTGEEEDAYLLLMKFFEAYLKLRESKLYKEDKTFVEKMITADKLKLTIANLESLKSSLLLRYKERENESLMQKLAVEDNQKRIETTKANKKLDPLQILAKKFINPIDFIDLISKSDLKLLVIDTRSKHEYEYSHMNLNILINKSTKSQVTFINISSDLIENVPWKIEELLKIQDNDSQWKIFSNRKDFDYLILFDNDSTLNSFKSDSKLSILKRALYEFEANDKLKNEPLILDGGWNEWINIYPGYSISSNFGNLPRESIKTTDNEQNALQALKKTLNFDYPEIISFKNPSQPLAQVNQPYAHASQTNIAPKTIQSETSKNEPEPAKTTNLEPVEPEKKQLSQKPIINRAIKPVDSNNSINSDLKNETSKTDPKKLSLDFSSSEEIEEEIIKPTSQLNKPIPQASMSNQSTVMVSNNQSVSHIKFVPPAVDNNEKKIDKNINNSIFETVYKPTRFRPIQMKDGASKVLDPNTGMFKIYTTSTQPPPKPQIVTTDKTKQLNDTINVRKDDTELKFQPRINTNETNSKKLGLKRTLSIPNIANMDEENEIKPEKLNDNKTNNENAPPRPKIKPVDPQNSDEKLQETDSIKQNTNRLSTRKPDKPSINRETKPMTDMKNLTLSRIPELQPTYADVTPGLTGIKNLGNTCFMNSIIQCLNSTKTLVDYFLSGQFRKDLNRTNELGFKGEIADEFSVIVSASWSGHCKTIVPRRFKNILGQFNQQFVSNEQQDAQELLLFLLDGLHEDLNKIKKRPKLTDKDDENDNLSDDNAANLAWNIHLSMNNSIIVDLFQGQFKSTVTCSQCQKQSVKFDAFMYLTLPILATKCNLYQCLELFLKPENMTGECKWKCPRCKQYRDAVKKIDIWKLPPILIVHLKRFKYHGLWRDKITTNVDFPIENLNLDKYILKNEKKGSQNYRLYAISNHSGTLDGGHYIANCRHVSSNKWFKYDDTDVKEVHDLASLKSPTSYILFYSLI